MKKIFALLFVFTISSAIFAGNYKTWPSDTGADTWPAETSAGTWPSDTGAGTWPKEVSSGTWPSDTGAGTWPKEIASNTWPSDGYPQTNNGYPQDGYPQETNGYPREGRDYPQAQPQRKKPDLSFLFDWLKNSGSKKSINFISIDNPDTKQSEEGLATMSINNRKITPDVKKWDRSEVIHCKNNNHVIFFLTSKYQEVSWVSTDVDKTEQTGGKQINSRQRHNPFMLHLITHKGNLILNVFKSQNPDFEKEFYIEPLCRDGRKIIEQELAKV